MDRSNGKCAQYFKESQVTLRRSWLCQYQQSNRRYDRYSVSHFLLPLSNLAS
jgi:hypothetical protein